MKLGNAAGSGIVFLSPAKIPTVFRDYQYGADEPLVRQLAEAANWTAAFEELARPLHEALYKEQSFDLLDRLSPLEQLILSFDYVQMQIGQGGFIQLFQNQYAPLLVTVIETTQQLDFSPDIRQTLDDALKVFVLNNESLGATTTPEQFARLYDEFREFEPLDSAFMEQAPRLMEEIVRYCSGVAA